MNFSRHDGVSGGLFAHLDARGAVEWSWHIQREWTEAGREIRQRSVTKSFSVLARAMRAEHPGLVFAHAAATGEIDPLTDLDSRLFAGYL
jgi:hypothetical protein